MRSVAPGMVTSRVDRHGGGAGQEPSVEKEGFAVSSAHAAATQLGGSFFYFLFSSLLVSTGCIVLLYFGFGGIRHNIYILHQLSFIQGFPCKHNGFFTELQKQVSCSIKLPGEPNEP